MPVIGLSEGIITKWRLARIWLLSPVLNIIGGTAMVLVVGVHGVLPHERGSSVPGSPGRC